MVAKTPDRMKWWLDARFGMFIHWGLYSVGGLDCWKMHDMGIPVEEYIKRFEKKFDPKRFDACEFAKIAKNAGCKYVVMGSRHHEGYCLWDTKTTKYSSVNMRPKRDFIAEYVGAIREAGLKVGFYYSLLDWRYKAYYEGPQRNPEGWAKLVKLVHAQVRELMTNYGKIDVLWFDGGWMNLFSKSLTEKQIADAWQSPKLIRMVRKLQPKILINNRAYPNNEGDFGTPEQRLTQEDRPWELCDTLGHLWGYAPQDKIRKSALEVVRRLIWCVAHGGNMLLNIGPKPDGSVQKWQAEKMWKIGNWVSKHNEAIYGCEAEPMEPFKGGLAPWQTTRKGNTLYIHLFHYPGAEFSIANIHDYYFKSATLIDTGEKLKITHEPTRDIISGMPKKAPDPFAPVVKISIRKKTAAEKKTSRWIGVDDPENNVRYI